jgi:hypothetical protein
MAPITVSIDVERSPEEVFAVGCWSVRGVDGPIRVRR